MNTYTRKIPTLAKSGSDSMRAEINFFILGMTLIVFNGLKSLTTLKDLSFTDPKESSNIPDITTIASIRFHPILKYDSG